MAGPGLLSSHCGGSAGKYSTHSLQTRSMHTQQGLQQGGLQSGELSEILENIGIDYFTQIYIVTLPETVK